MESGWELITYSDKDGLEDGTSLVPPPVRVTEEGAKKREYVNSSSPFADVVCSVRIVLTQHSCQKQNQVHSYPKERQRRQPLIHCIRMHNQFINRNIWNGWIEILIILMFLKFLNKLVIRGRKLMISCWLIGGYIPNMRIPANQVPVFPRIAGSPCRSTLPSLVQTSCSSFMSFPCRFYHACTILFMCLLILINI